MAGPVLGVVGGIANAMGAGQAGMEAQDAADFNAKVKTAQATEALQEGAENERRARIQSTIQIGNERATVAANNVQNTGSALDVLQSSTANAELDALTIRHQAQLTAWSDQMGAAADEMQGQAAATKAGYGVASGLLGAGKSIVG